MVTLVKKVGYLFVGHGTRNAVGQKQFQTVFEQFAQRVEPELAELAFLELAQPDIPAAVERLATRGATHLVTVPVFLFAAGHALQDIPQAVTTAAGQHGLHCAGQSAPLELSAQVLELSALRFRQAVCQVASEAACGKGCENKHCPQTALALIGRGSSSDEATEQMRQFACLRRKITPVAELLTGFVFAQVPTVEQCLQQLAASTCSIIVIQPHLLFEGELVEQLRQQVAEYAKRSPEQRWVITQTLGTDIALADTLAGLSREVADCGESR